MRESNLKTKYLILLQEPFSLDIPYAERQRVVVVTDEQVEAERLSRTRLTEEGEDAPAPTESGDRLISDTEIESAVGESRAGLVGRQFHRGLRGLEDVTASMKRTVNERAGKWALRQQLGALMIGRTESSVIHFDQGHPLKNFLYVGHPAKPDLYFPAAEFHRRVFEHKFVEAVTLLTSLGARRIGVQEIQGQTQEKEQTDLAGGAGFTRARSEESESGAMFEAEYPGSQKPVVPDGLCWYADEPTWQMIANARIVSGAQKTSLIVMYTTNYGIDTRVVKAAGACGVDIGGRFEEQRDTIWRLDAEFPGPAD